MSRPVVISSNTPVSPTNKQKKTIVVKPEDDDNIQNKKRKNNVDSTFFNTSSHESDVDDNDNISPRPARFNSYIHRELPKSTEEKEAELMEYYRQHPFRANPIRFRLHPESKDDEALMPTPKCVRAVTQPVPFNFHCEERAAKRFEANHHHDNAHSNLNQNDTAWQNDTSNHGNTTRGSCETRTVTIPEPFHLRTDERIKKRCTNHQEIEEEIEKDVDNNEQNIFRKQNAKPFQLTSVARHELHQKQFEEKMRQEEEERKKLANFRARDWNPQLFEFHDKKKYLRSNNKHMHVPGSEEDDLDKSLHELSEWYRSNNVGAFELMSIKRHEAYQRQFSEKVKKEEGTRRSSSFQDKPASYWMSLSDLTTHTSSTDITSKIVSSNQRAGSIISDESKTERDNQDDNPDIVSNNSPQIQLKTLLQPNKDEICNQQSPISTVDYNVGSVLILFVLLCCFRILNTFIVQSYFDPDEFWQTMEPAYCRVFLTDHNNCPGYTWEWKRRAPEMLNLNLIESSMLGPARTHLSILPVYWYYQVLKFYHFDSHWLVARGPLILNAIIVGAPVDLSVWYLATWMGGRRDKSRMILSSWCLFCSLSSWFNGYALVRTFANGQETLLLILALVLVSPEIIGNVNRTNFLFRASLCFLLGGLSVVIRFTAVAAFIPIGIILAFRYKSNLTKIGFLVFPCAFFGLVGIFLGMLVDKIFFGFLTIPFLANFHFNVILDNASLYGSHPWHWYFSAAVPAITGLLLPMLAYDFLQWITLQRPDNSRRNLWIVTLSYLTIMSFNAHKEFRYIHPILPLICLLSGSHLRTLFVGTNRSRVTPVRTFVVGFVFIIINLIAVCYLGLFHQSGPIAVNKRIITETTNSLVSSRNQTNVSVHYLTGACHSTPLLSHLHSPPFNFHSDIWHLDCSPDCRADPSRICDSERFSMDPIKFMQDTYFPCRHTARLLRNTCMASSLVSTKRSVPDYIVTFSKYANQVHEVLGSEGFSEIARYPHNVNGIRIGEKLLLVPDSNSSGNNTFRRFTFFDDFVEVALEDIVLFSRRLCRVVDGNKQCI